MIIPDFYNSEMNGLNAVLLPLAIAGIGIVASIIGTFFVRGKGRWRPPKGAQHR